MAVSLTIKGVTFQFPEAGETGFADDVLGWAQAVSQDLLQKSGGLFTLTAETDFGATYGVKSAYFKSRTASPAVTGQIRLANTDGVSWRNFENSGDLKLGFNAMNELCVNDIPVGSGGEAGPVVAADVSVVPAGTLMSTNVQAGLVELAGYIDALPAAVQTLTNKSISGSTNTLTNIPNSALSGVPTVAATPNTIALRNGSGGLTAAQGVFTSLTAPTGTTLNVEAGQADGPGAVGVVIGSATSYVNNTSKSISFRNGGIEMGYFNQDYFLVLLSNLRCSNLEAGNLFSTTTMAPVGLYGRMNDAPTAVGAAIGNLNDLTAVGSNIATFMNVTTEKLAVTKDGNLDFQNGGALLSYSAFGTKFTMNKSLDVAMSGGAVLTTDNIEVLADANIYGAAFFQNGLSTDPASFIATGTVFTDAFTPFQGSTLAFFTASAAADAGPDTVFETTVTRTAGTAFQINNNTAETFRVDYNGDGYLNSLKVVTETPAFLATFTPKTRCFPLPLEDWRVGLTAPGQATFGTAPRKSGWEYTAAGAGSQEMELYARIPYDLDTGQGINVLLSILLTAAETAGDTCNFPLQYVTAQSANDGGTGLLTGTATTATGVLTVASGKTAAGTLYKVRIPLNPADVNNPFTGDNYTIAMGLKRSAGTVGTVLLLGACIEYVSKV